MIVKHRRSSLAASVLTALALSLSACSTSGSGSPSGAGSGPSATTTKVAGTIRIAWWGGTTRDARTGAVIDLFKQAHPDVAVQTESPVWNDYFTKLNVEAASKTLPCVVQLQNRQVAEYVKSRAVVPLDNLVSSGAIDTSKIPAGIVDAGRGQDGKLYFLPYGLTYDAMVFNSHLAQQAGVTAPTGSYTWDQFFALVEGAKAQLPHGTYAVASMGDLANLFIDYVYANGTDPFDAHGKINFSKDQLTTYWNTWKKLSDEGVSQPADQAAEEPSAPEGTSFAKGTILASSFGGNRVAAVQKTLTAADAQATVVANHLPGGTGKNGDPLYASGFAISSNCDNISTAASFIDFFANDTKAGLAFQADNGAPSNSDVLQALLSSPDLSQATKADMGLYKKIVDKGPGHITFPPGYQAQFDASFKRNFDAVLFGKMNVSGAVDTFFSEVNPSLG